MEKLGPVRPIFKLDEEPKTTTKTERIVAGTNNSGMIIDVTKEGVEINSYYTGFNSDTKYSIFSNPVKIPWEELEKMKTRLNSRKRKSSVVPDVVEEEIDMSYLKSLPIVTINNNRFYIDPERRERRSVNRPEEVWRF